MTSSKSTEAEVLGAERRRRWSAAEKVAMVRETYEPGMTLSLVARRHGSIRTSYSTGASSSASVR